MNRITKAWKALRGTLKPEYVIADSAVVRDVYRVPGIDVLGFYLPPRFYASCQQAHQASRGRGVTAHKVLFIEGRHFWLPSGLREVILEPKPKRPKGRA